MWVMKQLNSPRFPWSPKSTTVLFQNVLKLPIVFSHPLALKNEIKFSNKSLYCLMFTCLNQRCDNSTLVNNFDYNVSDTLKKVYNTKMRNIADTEISLVHHVFDS